MIFWHTITLLTCSIVVVFRLEFLDSLAETRTNWTCGEGNEHIETVQLQRVQCLRVSQILLFKLITIKQLA